MKISTLLTAVALVSMCSSVEAQNWADRLKEKAENAAKRTVEDNVERKTEQAVDNAMNPGRNKDTN